MPWSLQLAVFVHVNAYAIVVCLPPLVSSTPSMKLGQYFLFLSILIGSVLADVEYQDDPYLAFRPAFVRSLPVQILLTGIVLTLTAVLFIHLLFTAQYHWALAPVNYVLQLSGVTTLLIYLIATIHVVLSATISESVEWPYMLSYIAVNVPPLNTGADTGADGWSFSEKATWLLMTASTAGLIQITHIQFLTLLYASKLEGRLIFTLLGPLAVVAAVMQLLPISNSSQLNTISSDVRNVCNATLSLLFTTALFVWGLLVNRKKAWRTDGGTAVFGVASLVLAVISTALNFLYVHKEEEFVWLPTLVWAVVLWQSFLGWWWWVGAGSNSRLTGNEDEMEEKLKRRAKRKARGREAEERKLKRKIKAQQVWQGVTAVLRSPHSSPTAVSSSVESNGSRSQDIGESTSPSQRRRRHSSSHNLEDEETQRTLSPTSANSALASSLTLTYSRQESTSRTTPQFMPDVLFGWYKNLRSAHIDAARLQAVERADRMRSMAQDREKATTNEEEDSRTQDSSGRITNGWRSAWSPWGIRVTSNNTTNGGNEIPGREDISHSDDPEDHGAERLPQETLNEEPARTNLKSSSIWWWGLLGRWRLQDSTTY